jgi:hypothetical protein
MPSTISLQKNEDIFFTIVACNYLHYAIVLGNSVKKYHPNSKFCIFIVDDINNTYAEDIKEKGFDLIKIKDLDIQNYRQFVFKYNITEAATGVKPFVFKYLVSKEVSSHNFIYLDPDILCFRRLDEIFDHLNVNSVVITPHSNSPILDENLFPDDYLFLGTGVYNLGFIAIKRTETSIKFINWWCQKLFNYCINLTEYTLFVDQKWINLVPAYFNEVLIFRNNAYNMAYWNLHERLLENSEGIFKVQPCGMPLAFFHFSGFDPSDLNKIFKYVPRNPVDNHHLKKSFSLDSRNDLLEIFNLYRELLNNANFEKYSKIPYAYSKYSNGEEISQLERSIFYKISLNHGETQIIEFNDPFETSTGSFWHICRKAGIRHEVIDSYSLSLDEVDQKYGSYYKYIHLLLKILMRVMGANLYLKFAKYMRHQLLPINQEFLIRTK